MTAEIIDQPYSAAVSVEWKSTEKFSYLLWGGKPRFASGSEVPS